MSMPRELPTETRRQMRIVRARALPLSQIGEKKAPGKWGHRVPSMPKFKALEKQGDEQ